jgi:hypothetical protein
MSELRTIEQVPITKLGLAHYMRNYDEYIGPMRNENLRLLELGIAEGDSLRHWASWLPRARIVGLDIRPRIPGLDNERVVTYQGEQQDRALLDRIGREQAPRGFDVIIDDASHVGQLTRISFWHLFDHHLKPGGYYFIEDWGTGYWSQYVDGRHYRPHAPEPMLHERLLTGLSKTRFVRSHNWLRRGVGWTRWHSVKRRHPSHQYGMVGFIKELVDECAMMDITRDDFGVGPQRPSRFEWLRLSLGHAIIRKPLEAPAPHDA